LSRRYEPIDFGAKTWRATEWLQRGVDPVERG
jgi:hypothetical protein